MGDSLSYLDNLSVKLYRKTENLFLINVPESCDCKTSTADCRAGIKCKLHVKV